MAEELTPKQRSAIERAKRNADLQPILFRDAKGLKWFMAFKEAGFLQPKAVPAPIPAKKAGFVNIPFWPVTEYLVAASEELVRPENKDYASEFLTFMRAATSTARSGAFSNYRVWWQFAKVMPHIPMDCLTDDDFSMVDYWIDDPYDRGIIASVLGGQWLIGLLENNDALARSIATRVLALLFKVNIIQKKADDPNSKELA
ncbi:MAG: hypothetical protein ACRECH_16960, partial [Nitrososphaerales archaeon]